MTEAMERKSNLVVPHGWYEIDKEEMSKVDGGKTVFADGMPSWMISGPLDVAFMACGMGLAWAPMKMFGKNMGGNLLKGFLNKTHVPGLIILSIQ